MLAWSENVHAGGRCARPAFAGPCLDQFLLKFGQTAQDRQHQPAVRRGGIGPCVGQRPEAGAALADLVQRIQKIACTPRQAIKRVNSMKRL